ncbi:thioredoxin F, chloroplastic-like isoform X3 [Salvia hispanica]|uniref:thioredoxin F, chloroplastic-like isoform X3 n=1 Tax=Salvia hispanica TaxID=49212 RepID=UPI00200915C1|nr:thioredoxin F, chloroplastic-like isoform X3 [Salvia hispanica]
MALQVYSFAPRTPIPYNSASPAIIASAKQCRLTVCAGAATDYLQLSAKRERRLRTKASSEPEAAAAAAAGQVTEVNKDTFWPIVKAAGDKIVVLDMYTQWCGPCKVMAPKFEELSGKHEDVVFLKLDCNQENKPLAKELGIKVVPTFKILKDEKVIKEVTGAKFDDLVHAIEIKFK